MTKVRHVTNVVLREKVIADAAELRYLVPIVNCARSVATDSSVESRLGPEVRYTMIPEGHALHAFFFELVAHHYSSDIGLRDPEVNSYVANMLTEFTEAEHLYAIRNASGKPLNDVGEMLLESDPVYGQAPSFDRERQVRKHIGDYTLFFTGMFPEAINHWRLRKARMENFVDFMKAGKESYYIVSKFEYFEYAKVAPLFAKLSAHFEECVYGLNQVKNDLAELQHPIVRKAQELIM